MEGYVYCLEHDAMVGFAKIGYTKDLASRMQSLWTSALPMPFKCFCAKKVQNMRTSEKKLHDMLDSKRYTYKREFFVVSKEEVLAAFDTIDGQYVDLDAINKNNNELCKLPTQIAEFENDLNVIKNKDSESKNVPPKTETCENCVDCDDKPITFTCERCGHTTNTKSNLLQHLRRKKECKPILSSQKREDYIALLIKREYNEVTYACKFCDKKFNTFQSKYRHHKTCKLNTSTFSTATAPPVNENVSDIMKELADRITQLEIKIKKPDKLSIDFGHEVNNISYGSLTNIVTSQNLPELIRQIYFDNSHNVNTTVRLKSLKMKLVEIVKDGMWQTSPMDKIMNEMVTQCSNILQQHYEEMQQYDEVSESNRTEIEEWLLKIRTKDRPTYRLIKDELIAMFDNYRTKKI